MSYPRTGNTGRTGHTVSANPNRRQGKTAMPDGTSSSRTRTGESGPIPRPGGSQPDRTGAPGHTTSSAGTSPPNPVKVESGRKITRVSEP